MCFYSAFLAPHGYRNKQSTHKKQKKHCTARSARTGHERQQWKQFAVSPLIRQTSFFYTVCLSGEVVQNFATYNTSFAVNISQSNLLASEQGKQCLLEDVLSLFISYAGSARLHFFL